MVLLLNVWMPRSKERRNPLISDTMATPVPTPISMPRSGGSVRSRFAPGPCPAPRNAARNSAAALMAASLGQERPAVEHRELRGRPGVARTPRATSLVAEGVHRVQSRRAHRGVQSEEDADHRR